MALAGALACQRDSYLKELTTKVTSCEPGQLTTLVSGKKQKVSGFEVILEDTVLFPEGGGQPDDQGSIGGVEVLRITRRGGSAVHFVPAPFDVGTDVQLRLDWTRRFDLMQQHSGQHLITAIAEAKFGYPTTSWSLGDKTSFIELDTPSMTRDQMSELEDIVNQKIQEGVRMYPTWYDSKDSPQLAQVRTRGLPEDHVGSIRVVTIEGVDVNMCCGTHVSNLNHLQIVKLLGVEKSKNKGKVYLVFVVGKRVLEYLERCYHNEKMITSLLKGRPDQHVELLDKLQKSYKVAQKNSTSLLRDVAVLEATRFKSDPLRPRLLSLHRKEGDNEFMNIIVNEISDQDVLIFLTVGDDKGSGLFLLSGREDIITDLGNKVAEILEGKGAGKKGRFQGKAQKLSRRPHAEKLLQDYVEGTSTIDKTV